MRVWGYPTHLLGKMQQMEAGIWKTASHRLMGAASSWCKGTDRGPFASLVSSNFFLPLLFLSLPLRSFSLFHFLYLFLVQPKLW